MASQTPNTPSQKKDAKNEKIEAVKKAGKSTFQLIGLVVILLITIVAFVFVPSQAGGGSNGQNFEFGSYNGQMITYAQGSYFAKQVQVVNDSMKQQGLSEQNFQLFAYQVWRQAFERTVSHIAILDAVKRAGGHVSEDYLDNKMAENPTFQEGGKFSPRLYREATPASKLALRDGLREDALISLYTEEVLSITPSSKELAFVKDMAKDTRTIEYALLPLAKYPDSEVAAWAASNAALFRRLKLSRITLSTKQADAEKILKQVKSDALAFEEAAKGNSTDSYADKGGAMGLKYFYEIQSDLDKKEDADKLAELKTGEYSAVLKTASGSFAFFRADDALFPADLKDASVLKDARAYMLRFERGKLEDWAIAQAKVLPEGPGAAFEANAKKASLELATAGPFPLNFADADFAAYGQRIPLFNKVNSTGAAALAQASTNEAFLTAAFSVAPGAVSKPLVLGDSVLVLKVKEAGVASEDQLSSLALYYPYFFQQKTSAELSSLFLKSPALKDNFMTVFFKYFAPKQS